MGKWYLHGGSPALGIEADTGPRLMPVQYEQKARAAGNALINLFPKKKL
jgi:hypothetical protein